MKKRKESDTFGTIEVESDRYWGAQSQRSIENFKIGWEKQPSSIIRGLGIVKSAAAKVNMDFGLLDKKIGNIIPKKQNLNTTKARNIFGFEFS